MNKICDECETVAHCTKHGCIPKVSVNEAMKLALEALERMKRFGNTFGYRSHEQNPYEQVCDAITALREALAKPAQPKYRRGDRLICLETEEYCVIHISGTDRQWVKFPTSYIGVYTNEQVAELFELLPKEPAQRKPLADDQLLGIWNKAITQDNGRGSHLSNQPFVHIARAIEAAHGIKENT